MVIIIISTIHICAIISINSSASRSRGSTIVIIIEPVHRHYYRYAKDILSYELVQMLQIATLKLSVLFVCTMQIVQENTDDWQSLVSLSLSSL